MKLVYNFNFLFLLDLYNSGTFDAHSIKYLFSLPWEYFLSGCSFMFHIFKFAYILRHSSMMRRNLWTFLAEKK